MEHYVAGWDGGGTKTAMQILDMGGKVLFTSQTGGLNFNSHTEQELKAAIHTLITEMSMLPGGLEACEMLCISTAGISNPQAMEFIARNIKETGLTCELKIVGDHEAALYGALGKAYGMVLISGTGSICYGQNLEGCKARAGGRGHIIDDEGSGYAIGRDILSAAVQSHDKRIPKSILYDMVLEKIGGASIEDIIQYIYRATTGKKDIAAFAPLLLAAINQKDQQAIAIGDKASSALIQLVLPVAQELGLEQSEIALSGGVLTHFEAIREKVVSQLLQRLPKLKITEAKHDSVSGAALLALGMLHKRRKS